MANVLSNFPHSSYRPYQKEIIQTVQHHIDNDVKYIILQAPTGIGKTAAAGTLGSHADDAYFLAEQKIHQDHVKDEFPDATGTAKGKRNYCCGQNREPACPDAVPMDSVSCPYKPKPGYNGELAAESAENGEMRWKDGETERCPYMVDKTNSMNQQLACLNYSYFLAETYYKGDFGQREVMIADEAHNVESALQSFLTFEIENADMEEEFGMSIQDQGDDIDAWIDWLSEDLAKVANNRLQELDRHIKSLWDDNEEIPGDIALSRKGVEELQSNLFRVKSENFDGLQWAIERNENDLGMLESVKVSPVSIAPFAKRFLFDHADHVVLMSATISDYEVLARSLGLTQELEEGNVAWVDVPSPFPPENRPVTYYDAPVLNHKNKHDKMPSICRLINGIAHKHQNESGLIHTVSFSNEELILEHLDDDVKDRVIHHHDDEDRDHALERFKQTENGILLSPSMFEGVDLKGDMSRWQIVLKVPYPSLGSEQVKLRKDEDPEWYNWRTAVKLIQSFGRSVRSEDDHASTYILDGGFEDFYNRTQSKYFPDYLTDEAIQKGNIRDLVQLCKA